MSAADIPAELRADIVRLLRREADRIEAGGVPACYAYNIDERELWLSVAEAQAATADPEEFLDDGDWPEDIEAVEWGVCVTVREMKLAAHGKSRNERHESFADYEMRAPDDKRPPALLEWECPECGFTGKLKPHEACPECAVTSDAVGSERVRGAS